MPTNDKKARMFVVAGNTAGPASPAGDRPYAPNRRQDKREPVWKKLFDIPVRMGDETLVSFIEGEWFFPHTNTNNQSGYLKVRVQPALLDYFEMVVGSGHFPYKTVEDVIRHGAERHARFLYLTDPELGADSFTAFNEIQKIMKREAHKSNVEEIAVALLKRLKELMANSHFSYAADLADEIKQALSVCAPGPLLDEQVAVLEAHIGQISKQLEEKAAPLRAAWEARKAKLAAEKEAEKEAEEAVAAAAAAAAPAAKRRPKSYTENVLDESDYKVRTYGPPPDLE